MYVNTKYIDLILTLLFISSTFAENEVVREDDGSERRIVNATRAPRNSRPFMVVIQEAYEGEYGQFCGGTLINDKWVLTAAHCFDDMPDIHIKLLVRVKVGAYTAYTKDPNEVIRAIDKVFIHPLYDQNDPEAYYDIALLKLRGPPLEFKANIQPILLPDGHLDVSNVEGEVVGWGAITSDGSRASDELLYGNVKLGATKACNQFSEHHESRLCLIGTSTACVGDSGGPFVAIVNGKPVQVGVISIGGGTCQPRKPFIVTNVQHYLDFINEIISKH